MTGPTTNQLSSKHAGFTIVELLIVIVVIGILAAIVLVAFNGVTQSARNSTRIAKVKEISKALERYYVMNNQYPPVQDAYGTEGTPCGSPTENWGQCDRNKALTDALAPYMTIDPTSLSSTAPNAVGSNYYYTSPPATGPPALGAHQMYGLMIFVEGNAGDNDGGNYTGAYEVGNLVGHCKKNYTGNGANWRWAPGVTTLCQGGN